MFAFRTIDQAVSLIRNTYPNYNYIRENSVSWLEKIQKEFDNCRESGCDFKGFLECMFNIDTYDEDMCEIFLDEIFTTISHIVVQNTLTLVKSEKHYKSYLYVVNMSFLKPHLDWGTSIRFPCFDVDNYKPFNNSTVIQDNEKLTAYFIALTVWYCKMKESSDDNLKENDI